MKKIAILSSLGIGDIITLEPLLRKLKKEYPNSKITIYSIRGGYLEKSKIKNVDKIIKIDSLQKKLRFFFEKSDLLINLGYYSKFSRVREMLAYYLITFLPRAGKRIYNGNLNSIKFKHKNMVKLKLDILKQIGIKINEKDYELSSPFDYKLKTNEISNILEENSLKESFLILIHAGAKKGISSRFWEAEKWAKIAEWLKEKQNAKVCFIGSSDDSEETKKIISKIHADAIDLTGKLSLEETIALIEKCNLFLSTNSGPMWLAAMLKKPQVVISAPSKFSWNPCNKKAIVVRGFSEGKNCPCDDNKCVLCAEAMKNIQIDEVKEAIKEVIKYV